MYGGDTSIPPVARIRVRGLDDCSPSPMGLDQGLRVCGGNVAKMRKRGYSPPKIREDVVNRLVELYKKNHPEEFQNVPKVTGRGYSPPKVNRDEVEKLKELYRQKHPEEFPNLRKRLPPGYPVNHPRICRRVDTKTPLSFLTPWKHKINRGRIVR